MLELILDQQPRRRGQQTSNQQWSISWRTAEKSNHKKTSLRPSSRTIQIYWFRFIVKNRSRRLNSNQLINIYESGQIFWRLKTTHKSVFKTMCTVPRDSGTEEASGYASLGCSTEWPKWRVLQGDRLVTWLRETFWQDWDFIACVCQSISSECNYYPLNWEPIPAKLIKSIGSNVENTIAYVIHVGYLSARDCIIAPIFSLGKEALITFFSWVICIAFWYATSTYGWRQTVSWKPWPKNWYRFTVWPIQGCNSWGTTWAKMNLSAFVTQPWASSENWLKDSFKNRWRDYTGINVLCIWIWTAQQEDFTP